MLFIPPIDLTPLNIVESKRLLRSSCRPDLYSYPLSVGRCYDRRSSAKMSLHKENHLNSFGGVAKAHVERSAADVKPPRMGDRLPCVLFLFTSVHTRAVAASSLVFVLYYYYYFSNRTHTPFRGKMVNPACSSSSSSSAVAAAVLFFGWSGGTTRYRYRILAQSNRTTTAASGCPRH